MHGSSARRSPDCEMKALRYVLSRPRSMTREEEAVAKHAITDI